MQLPPREARVRCQQESREGGKAEEEDGLVMNEQGMRPRVPTVRFWSLSNWSRMWSLFGAVFGMLFSSVGRDGIEERNYVKI